MKSKIKIYVDNNKCKIEGRLRYLNRMYDELKCSNPNAFHLRKYMPRGWDGKYHFVTDRGYVSTGLLPNAIKWLKENDLKYKLYDVRDGFSFKPKALEKTLGSFNFRPYQTRCIKSVVTNFIDNLYYPQGVLKMATNSGKTLLSAGIHDYYNSKTLFIMNSTELFGDAMEEMPKFLGKENVGWISPKEIKWAPFMICMVKTMSNRMRFIKDKLKEYRVRIVDEGDLSNNKTYKFCLKACDNCVVSVALSGSIFVSKLKKDEMKNILIQEYYGPELDEVSQADLIEQGYSSPVDVRFIRGNTDPMKDLNYTEQYDEGIVNNKQRNRKVWKRVNYHFGKKRFPILVICKRHEHIENLMKMKKLMPEARVEWVHHDRKDRKKIVTDFKDGKIDVLIGSMILGRGKNFPFMRYMLNAGGGKGEENSIQIIGRATRKGKDGLGRKAKKKTYFEDFWDLGKYLKVHSKKREIAYKKQKFKVINEHYCR